MATCSESSAGIETIPAAQYAAEWKGQAVARDVYMAEIPGRAGAVVCVGEKVDSVAAVSS